MKAPTKRWPGLRVDRSSGQYRIPQGSAAGRRQAEDNGTWQGVRRGWFLGEDRFKEELLAQASGQVGANHYGVDRQETGNGSGGTDRD